MKATIESPETEVEKINYPCLMHFKRDKNIIILFNEQFKGVVMKHSGYKTGTYKTDWLQEEYWTPYKGKICLEND